MNSDIEYAEEQVGNSMMRMPGTRWKHPGGRNRLSFELHIRGPVEDPQTPGKWLPRVTRKYVFLGSDCPPEVVPHATVVRHGDSTVIASEHDRAIQKVDPTGSFIESGLCPQLVRVVRGSGVPIPQHPALTAPPALLPAAVDPDRIARLRRRATGGAS